MTTAYPSIFFTVSIYNLQHLQHQQQQQQKNSRDIINFKTRILSHSNCIKQRKKGKQTEKRISKIIAVFDTDDRLVEKIERNLNYGFLVG